MPSWVWAGGAMGVMVRLLVATHATRSAIALAAGVSALLDYRFISRALKVEGEVVRVNRLNVSASTPIVQFTPIGETDAIEFFGNNAPDYGKYEVGDRATILYIQDDQNPFDIHPRIYSLEESLYLHELFLMVLGVGRITAILTAHQWISKRSE